MAYFTNKVGIGGYSKLNDTGLSGLNNSGVGIVPEFYEMEPAVVLDVILDNTHAHLKDKKVDLTSLPDNYNDKVPDKNDMDTTWIGRALVRLCFSQQGLAQDKLNWALPLDVTGVVEYPLVNEVVIVVKYFGNLYYTKRLNARGTINNSANYKLEKVYGINQGTATTGPVSVTTNSGNVNSDYVGSIGNYFLSNNIIRRLVKFEGDTSIESRFGQSIRFAVYDDNRKNDVSSYKDYSGNKTVFSNKNFGGGNPMVLIRNRQRIIANDKPYTIHPKLPTIPKITELEKNVGGLIQEDINHDGSSIHITSGLTKSKWITTVYKSMFESGKEEQHLYSPKNSTKFIYPALIGDQIVINTDRIIFSSRFGETFHYSKKRYGIVTDSEYSLDSHDQVVLTTNTKTVINSPAIYLGQYDDTNEPALLGQTAVDWLYDLCNWLLVHTHWYKHSHPTGGGSSPDQTQIPVQQQELINLRDHLHKLLSRRVFVTGGGYALGANGVLPNGYKDGVNTDVHPVNINVANGNGVPGTFKGKNRREKHQW